MQGFIRIFIPILLVSMLISASLFGVTAQDGSDLTAFATNTPMSSDALPIQATPTSTPDTSSEVVVSDSASSNTGAPITSAPVELRYPDECAYVPNQPTSQACINFMNRNPNPRIERINVDGYTLGQYSFWRVGPQAVATYDAPNGTPVGTIPEGFNFVNVVNQNEGWIQSETGQWIRKQDASYVQATRFRGATLKEGWSLPFGWILDQTGIYASSFPGGAPDSSTGLVPLHYQRFNIYAEAEGADGWTYYLVGPDQWVKQIYMTVIKPTPRPDGVTGRWVAVDLFEQSLVAYEGNTPVFATLISTGLPGTETNEGLFEVWAQLDRDAMSGATGAPDAYALQSVPWVLYFDDSISIHGTYWHDDFGYRRSRGCVNLSISDAKWIYDFFNNAPPNNGDETSMWVYVHSSGEYRS